MRHNPSSRRSWLPPAQRTEEAHGFSTLPSCHLFLHPIALPRGGTRAASAPEQRAVRAARVAVAAPETGAQPALAGVAAGAAHACPYRLAQILRTHPVGIEPFHPSHDLELLPGIGRRVHQLVEFGAAQPEIGKNLVETAEPSGFLDLGAPAPLAPPAAEAIGGAREMPARRSRTIDNGGIEIEFGRKRHRTLLARLAGLPAGSVAARG